MKRTMLIMLFGIIMMPVFNQQNESNTAWMEYIEELAESEMDENLLENLFNELSYLSEHPFNLYTVSKTDLERLPFLSQIQVENLLYYIYKNSPLLSIYELRNVDDLDIQTITYLLPFVYLGESPGKKEKYNPKQLLKYGKHELLLRSDYCFQEKAGYKNAAREEKEKNPSKYYLGEPFYLSVKYGFSYKEKIQFGIACEKDPGEAFWNKYNKEFDFYSAHLVIKDIGIIQSIHLGDYRLSFGQGLVLNTDFSMGKTSDITNINKKYQGFKRHFSTNENDFFRGGAISLKLNNTNLNLFVSRRDLDANADSSTIFTIKTDGYNRTIKDLEKKNQARIDVAGANFQWSSDFLKAGITWAYYQFGGKTLNPDKRPYNLFYLRGKDNQNLSINYSYRRKKISFQGETAISRNLKKATLNTLQINPVSFAGLAISYRNYAKDYQALYGRAFSESSTIQNESGFYLGTYLKLFKSWELRAYFDFIKFPWLKYGIDSPSEAKDVLCQLTYKPRNNWNFVFRYKYKEKEKNFNTEDAQKPVSPYEQHHWRLHSEYQIKKALKFRTQIHYNILADINNKKNTGWAISQSGNYNPAKLPFKLDVGIAYFYTPDWDTRISLYEKNILYAFSFTTFYGEGIRYYTILKLDILKNLCLYAKYSCTQYFDREIISSELEEISGQIKNDISCLIKLKF